LSGGENRILLREKPRGEKLRRQITVLLSLVLSLTATAFSQKPESPANLAKSFLQSLARQQIEDARRSVDERFTGDIRGRLKLNAAFFKKRKLKLIEVVSEKVFEQSAQIEIKLTDKSKNTIECQIIFYKNLRLNEWKIIYWSFAAILPKPAPVLPKNQPKTKSPTAAPPKSRPAGSASPFRR
jgi:hypothetical protein